jgi:hypothetical protein
VWLCSNVSNGRLNSAVAHLACLLHLRQNVSRWRTSELHDSTLRTHDTNHAFDTEELPGGAEEGERRLRICQWLAARVLENMCALKRYFTPSPNPPAHIPTSTYTYQY